MAFACTGAAWDAGVTRAPVGTFPPLDRGLSATYRVGWGGVAAARAKLEIKRNGSNFEVQATTVTQGAARVLFSLDANLKSTVAANTLRPILTAQDEERSNRTIRERVRFTGQSAERWRLVLNKSGDEFKPAERKTYASEVLHDFFSAYLFLRSQTLADSESYTLAVMSPSVPYILTMTVRAHEEIALRSGKMRAIRFSVDAVSKVGDEGVARPQKKFRRATVWVADDASRRILRVESQVFIGSVFLEID